MLLGARFKNFMSFNQTLDMQPVSFSFLPGKVQANKWHIYESGKFRVLKYTSFFGANAAGKSSFVKALCFIQMAVMGDWPKRYMESYFKLVPSNSENTSVFEIEILLDGAVYSYGFEMLLKKGRFVKEWLRERRNKSTTDIFYRSVADSSFNFDDRFKQKGLGEKLDIYAGDISSDGSVLLLKILNQNKAKLYEEYPVANVIRRVYRWITRKLSIAADDAPLSYYSYLLDKSSVERVNEIINHFRVGIKNLEIVDVSLESVLAELPPVLKNSLLDSITKNIERTANGKNIQKGITLRYNKNMCIISFIGDHEYKCQTIRFKHGTGDVLFDFWEESDGTIRLLDLLEVLLSDVKSTFVIDEFDLRLHPSLAHEFVNYFLKQIKDRDVQLIITTHETELMDLNMVRRDEIQLLQKGEDGSTSVIPFRNKGIRVDKVLNKEYLKGTYGGVSVYES